MISRSPLPTVFCCLVALAACSTTSPDVARAPATLDFLFATTTVTLPESAHVGLPCSTSATNVGGGCTALQHFIFFGRDRERIAESTFATNAGIAGAQIKYTWRELEPQRDRYDFAKISEDLATLARHDKRLWIQLQDVSFAAEARVVPDYLLDDPAFGGGVASEYEGEPPAARVVGRMARRWDPAVRARFARLLDTLGRVFDGKIEGLNFAETAFSVSTSPAHHPPGFSYDAYAEAVKAIMSAGRSAFPRSHVMVYANFMPGEWLPDNDRGYLRGVYAHAEGIGVSVGGPDLLPYRRGQRNHSLRLITARGASTVAGLAVQDGNLAERNPATGARVRVAELVCYAMDTLRLDYLFWGTEEPYYSNEVLPWLSRRTPPCIRSTPGSVAPPPTRRGAPNKDRGYRATRLRAREREGRRGRPSSCRGSTRGSRRSTSPAVSSTAPAPTTTAAAGTRRTTTRCI